eukprot:748881-Hanusia_phi.AAC.2
MRETCTSKRKGEEEGKGGMGKEGWEQRGNGGSEEGRSRGDWKFVESDEGKVLLKQQAVGR